MKSLLCMAVALGCSVPAQAALINYEFSAVVQVIYEYQPPGQYSTPSTSTRPGLPFSTGDVWRGTFAYDANMDVTYSSQESPDLHVTSMSGKTAITINNPNTGFAFSSVPHSLFAMPAQAMDRAPGTGADQLDFYAYGPTAQSDAVMLFSDTWGTAFDGTPLPAVFANFNAKEVMYRVAFDDNSSFSARAWITSFTQVPEPGSMTLLGLGLAGLVAARRRAG